MDWRIQKRRNCCARCDKPFAPNSHVFSAIYSGEEGFERRDVCAACWKPGDDVFSYWRHRLEPPKEPRLAGRTALMGLFRNLTEADDDRKRNFRYVLALALLRRRALKMVETRTENGVEQWLLRAPKDDSEHVVDVRPMTETAVESLVAELTHVIEIPGETETPAASQVEEPSSENRE